VRGRPYRAVWSKDKPTADKKNGGRVTVATRGKEEKGSQVGGETGKKKKDDWGGPRKGVTGSRKNPRRSLADMEPFSPGKGHGSKVKGETHVGKITDASPKRELMKKQDDPNPESGKGP